MSDATGKMKILVTGVSGFIGSHCVLDLLSHGYEVKGTIRNLDRADRLRRILSNHNPDAANMEIVAATLDKADGWDKAMEGCSGVFHVASPVPAVQPKNPAEVIEPAVEGTLNVLTAAKEAGIKRVILTSSVAAVQGSTKMKEFTYTGENWSDPSDPRLSPYAASKTIAEKAAWEFIEDSDIGLTVINPGMVMGPALEADYGTSLEILVKLFSGAAPMAPRLGFEVVDVRDVASLHRIAFEKDEAIGKRLLCGAGFRWFIEIARVLRQAFPDQKGIPGREMPNFLSHIFALFVKEVAAFLDDLEVIKRLDCSPAHDLGWQPRSPEEAIIAGGKSLIDLGIAK